jgi:hypothetical protein
MLVVIPSLPGGLFFVLLVALHDRNAKLGVELTSEVNAIDPVLHLSTTIP